MLASTTAPEPMAPRHRLDQKAMALNSEQQLLAFLCLIADGYEPRNNLFPYLIFGPRAFHVLDSINLESKNVRILDPAIGLKPTHTL